MRRNQWTWLGFFLLGIVVLLWVLFSTFPGAIQGESETRELVYSLTLLVLVGGSIVLGWRDRASLALKQALAWVGIFLAIVIAYSYREPLGGLMVRTQAELTPTVPRSPAYGVASIGGDASGHFRVDGTVNGTHVRFLVDTGATDIALTAFDAQRLGFDPKSLDYTVPYRTANGVAYAARITLDEVAIGSVSVRNVTASVSQEGLDESLLGMSFLGRLSGFEVSGDRLILTQ